jgi:hypothetical protein
MGTIVEFRQSRTQRSPPAETEFVAQIVIFPGVRIERQDVAEHRFVTVPAAGPGNSPRQRLSKEQEH